MRCFKAKESLKRRYARHSSRATRASVIFLIPWLRNHIKSLFLHWNFVYFWINKCNSILCSIPIPMRHQHNRYLHLKLRNQTASMTRLCKLSHHFTASRMKRFLHKLHNSILQFLQDLSRKISKFR
jgi:hypothetical protein